MSSASTTPSRPTRTVYDPDAPVGFWSQERRRAGHETCHERQLDQELVNSVLGRSPQHLHHGHELHDELSDSQLHVELLKPVLGEKLGDVHNQGLTGTCTVNELLGDRRC